MKKIIKDLAEKMGDIVIDEFANELYITVYDSYLDSSYREVEGDLNEEACDEFFEFLNANANNTEFHEYGSDKYYFNDFVVVVAYTSNDI